MKTEVSARGSRRLRTLILVWFLAASMILVLQESEAGPAPSAAVPEAAIRTLHDDFAASDPPGPAQAPHSVDAILVFLRQVATGNEVWYAFRGHEPALPTPVDAPLTWNWFSGNPAAPNLGAPAVLAAESNTKQARVAWSRHGYAMAAWDTESVYGVRMCPQPPPDPPLAVSLFKSTINYSLFQDGTGGWTPPAVAASPLLDNENHTRFLGASIAIDNNGNGLLVYVHWRTDACTGAGSREIRYSVWNGTTRTFGASQFLSASNAPPLIFIEQSAAAFASRLAAAGATTRQHGIASWWDQVGFFTKSCPSPPPDPPFDLTVPLYWPKFARWDGNGFVEIADVPGRRPTPGNWESLQVRLGLAASPDQLTHAAITFSVRQTPDPCPFGGVPENGEVWRALWNATGNTWDAATKVADGEQPSVAYRTALPRDRAYMVYQGPPPAAPLEDPPINRSALNGSASANQGMLGAGTKGFSPTIAHLGHNVSLVVWNNGTSSMFFAQRDDGTGAETFGAFGQTGNLPFLAARTGSPHLPHAEWSYLYYMSHDAYGIVPTTTLINRHEAAGSTALVNMIQLIDRGQDPMHTREYYVRRGAGTSTELRDLGQVNMAASNTLRDFIARNTELYPARDSILVLRDHGKGWRGVCVDRNPTPGDWINMTELRTALTAANRVFRLAVFSACQMAAIEVAHQIGGFATYMIASQENHLTPNDGVGIREDQYLGRLIADPVGHADNFLPFASQIVTEYQANNVGRYNRRLTLSLVDVTRVPALVNDVGAFRNAVLPLIDRADPAFDAAVWAALSNHRNNTQGFVGGGGAWRDLFHFMSRVQGDAALPAAARNAAQAVLNHEAAVVRSEWSDTAAPDARGLNFYFIATRVTYNQERVEYARTRFDQATSWRDVVRHLSHTRGVALRLEASSPWLFVWIRDLTNRTVGTYSDVEDCGGFCQSDIPEASCDVAGLEMRIFLPGWTEPFDWFVDGTLLPASGKGPAPRSTAFFNLTIQEVVINETSGETVVLYEEAYGGTLSTNETQSGRFFPDIAGPVTTASLAGTLGLGGWYTTSVSVTLTASDPRSGVASTSYRVDGGAWQTYVAPFPIAGDDNHSLEYFSTDLLGNREANRSLRVLVDTTRPSSTHSLSGTPGGGGWYVTPVTVNLTASDATSGVDRVEYSIDGGALQTYTIPFVVGEGMHTVEYNTTDVAGLSELPNSFALNVDTTSPSTTASLSGIPGLNNWYVSPVTVTLSPTEGGSGLAGINYSIDGGASWQPYAEPFVISADGNTTVEYNATDVSGNREPTRTTIVRIDRTPPTTGHSLTGVLGTGGWYVSSVTVALSFTDATSGVANVTYSLDGGPPIPYAGPFVVTGDKVHVVNYSATDAAGNAESTRSASVPIDENAPSSSATIAGAPGRNGWYVSSVTVTLTATDGDGSGVAQIRYRVDGMTWIPYTGPFGLFDGDFLLEYAATDNASLEEPTVMLPVRVDSSAPSTTAGFSGTQGLGGWYTSPVAATLSPSDTGSGVDVVEYRLDGGSWISYQGTFTIPDGDHLVEYRATDIAGNVESLQSAQVPVDSTPPTTTVTPAGTPGANGWYVSSVTVTLSRDDATSGPAGTEYSLDGGSFQPYAVPIVVATDLSHVLDVRSRDVAGNVEAAVTRNVLIDTLAPACSLAFSGTSGAGGWFVSTVIATVSCTDATSGVSSTQYRLDGGGWTAYPGPVTVGTDGVHTFEFNATDTAGLFAEDSQVLQVDATDPQVTITSPSAGTRVQGTSVDVTWTTIEAGSGRASCLVTLDGGTARDPGATDTMRFDGLATGSHTVVTTCRDVAGNEGTGSVTFTSEAVPIGGLLALVVAAILVFAGALVLIVFLLRRRRGKEQAEEELATDGEAAGPEDEEDEFEL